MTPRKVCLAMPTDGCKIAAFPSIASTALTDARSLVDTLAFRHVEKCSDRQPVHELDDVKVKDHFRFIFIISMLHMVFDVSRQARISIQICLRASTQREQR